MRPTAHELVHAIDTDARVARKRDVYGAIILTAAGRRLAIATGWDDGDTVWGWTWTAYVADVDAPGGWDELTTHGTDDAAEARRAIGAWYAATLAVLDVR